MLHLDTSFERNEDGDQKARKLGMVNLMITGK